jgi:hypothetical protein
MNKPRGIPLNAQQIHRHGVLRLQGQPDGSTCITAVRIVNRVIRKRRLALSAEEVAALDAGLNELFRRRAETPVQLELLEPPRSELVIPLPRAPRTASTRRFSFARRGGKR